MASNPKEGLGSVAKILGRKWTALTDAEKKPFQEEAAAAKELYQKELAEFGPIEVSVGDYHYWCLKFRARCKIYCSCSFRMTELLKKPQTLTCHLRESRSS